MAGDRIEKIALPREIAPASSWDVQAITRDHKGDLWVSIVQHDVYRWHQGVWAQYGDLAALPKLTAVTLWTDESGRVWFGYMQNKVALLEGGRVKLFSASDGLKVGNVTALGSQGAHIWVSGQSGLALFSGNRFHAIVGESDAGFTGISGVVET
jgi:ligand-binding sensor domain-containing protein